MAHLENIQGFNRGKSISIDDNAILGRSPENSISLPDHRVSRQHARITRVGHDFFIEDLNSTNGVILRGERIPLDKVSNIHDGDEIRICSTRMIFRTDEPSSTTHQYINGSALTAGTAVTKEISLQENFGALTLTMLKDDISQPKVAATIDASADVIQVKEGEKHSDKGLQDALKRLQAICQVSIALGAISDREELLQKILNCIFDLFPAAERSFIMQYNMANNNFVPVMAKKRHEDPSHWEEVPISRTIIDEVTEKKHSILSFDAMGDERFNDHDSIMELSIRSMMCAPLLVGEELLGVIQVDTNTGLQSFTEEDLQVLTGISTQAAIAVKNMQLYEAIEAETARRTSLQRYFSPGLVDMLMSGDLSTALGGSAYRGTVLFSDIIGFTAMSESLSPTEVVAQLNRYFTVMQKLIYDNGGNVDKFSGDAIMAFWGVPHTDQPDERHAVLTALQMQEALWSFNLTLESEDQQSIHMGVGINTGEFVAGNVGSEDKIEFTLIGDSVNLAARIEDRASRSQVLISEATWESIKELVCAIQLPSTMLKGKSAPVTIYSVRAIQTKNNDGCAMALPCLLYNTNNHPRGSGIITGSQGNGQSLQLFLNTDTELTTGAILCVELVMPEYDRTLHFTVRTETCAVAAHEGEAVYSKAVLTDITNSEALNFLTPGSCLITNHTWGNLGRS